MLDRFQSRETVLGDTADGLYVVNANQRIVRWNLGAQRLLGYRADEVLNRHCHDVIGGCGRDGLAVCGPDCPVHRCVERGELPESMEVHARTRDGRRIWLHVTVIVIPHGPRRLVGHVLHDVTGGRTATDTMAQVTAVLQATKSTSSPEDLGRTLPGSTRFM
jgi:PAS domain S-box-containing protein